MDAECREEEIIIRMAHIFRIRCQREEEEDVETHAVMELYASAVFWLAN